MFLKEQLESILKPPINYKVHIFEFRGMRQFEGESLIEYMTRLKTASKKCNFADSDYELKTQIMQLCRSEELKKRALKDPLLNLEGIIKLGRTIEAVAIQFAEMKKCDRKRDSMVEQSVNRLSDQYQQHKPQQDGKSQTCRQCGYKYSHSEGRSCPAEEKSLLEKKESMPLTNFWNDMIKGHNRNRRILCGVSEVTSYRR